MILSENWTLAPPRDLAALERMAVAAEDAGFDGVMVSEHVALGAGSDAGGLPENPREYALPGNQGPSTPWPDSLLLLAAVSAATSTTRLIASSIIAPLRHPILLAKQLATLDLLSEGRLVVQPTVGWHRSEYDALGVPFAERGRLLDEHLAAWRALWSASPASFAGDHYSFRDVHLEPKPVRAEGPPLWFGGQTVHQRLLHRLTTYGSGFNPLGRPSDDDLELVRGSVRDAGRDLGELEMVGGTRGRFPSAASVADLGEALASIPEQMARGFGTICIKPSQFVDDPAVVPAFCREVVERVERLSEP
ncbi:MAG TPA: TIGR03619 family F420-dependent LLM class oxidoreductase [Actinomycetota bacterium]|nr:TIGR03619 family F420-dependent LLM class oxidoreductase [Actinomycetota bacterium]